MAMGTKMSPTEADADPQEIYESTLKHLETDFQIKNPEQYTVKMALIEEKRFFYSPVWVVYVSDDNTILWKGLFWYNGLYMTLVPAEQEYKSYTVNDSYFPTYANKILGNLHLPETTASGKIYRILRGQADKEEIIHTMNELLPVYLDWKRSFPRGDDQMEELIRLTGYAVD